MVLERSFDSADLKRLLADSDMLVDRSLRTPRQRQHATSITRPPMPRGSCVFEKVLDEFQQSERLGPKVEVSEASTEGCLEIPQYHNQIQDPHRLSPYYGRSRANSRSDPPRSQPSSARRRSFSRPSSGAGPGGVPMAKSSSSTVPQSQRPSLSLPHNPNNVNK